MPDAIRLEYAAPAGDPSARAVFVRGFHEAMRQYGACILRNPPVATPPGAVPRALKEGGKFFRLPTEAKRAYEGPDVFTPGFFSEDGTRALGSEIPRQAMTVLRQVPHDAAYADYFDHENQDPAETPDLLPMLASMLHKTDALIVDLLSALGEASGTGAERLSALARNGHHNLRLFQYTPPEKPHGDNGNGSSAVREHFDYSLLTTICGRTQQNLEILDAVDNGWKTARLADDEVCILTGATLKAILREKIHLTMHRVKCGPPSVADLSITCFAAGNTRPFSEIMPGLDVDAPGDAPDNAFALSLHLFNERQREERT